MKTMNENLGILVNSLNYFDHVIELARAAHAKGKEVRIHLSLQGIFLMQDKDFDELSQIASVTVCRESVGSLDLPAEIGDMHGDLLVEPSKLSEVLADCDRCVAF